MPSASSIARAWLRRPPSHASRPSWAAIPWWRSWWPSWKAPAAASCRAGARANQVTTTRRARSACGERIGERAAAGGSGGRGTHGPVPHPRSRRTVGRGPGRHLRHGRRAGHPHRRAVRHARGDEPSRPRGAGRRRHGGRPHRAPLRGHPRSPGGGRARARGEADGSYAGGGQRALPRGASARTGAPRRPRGALQRRRPGAPQDREATHPHRVAPPRTLRAPGAARLRGHGSHDPRHRHRPGAGGQRAAPHELPRPLHSFPPARRLHRAELRRPGHPDPPARCPGVHPQPRVHPLSAGLLRRAPLRAQGQSTQARDPAPDLRGADGPGDRPGGPLRDRGSPGSRRSARDRADDPRWPGRGRLAQGSSVERRLAVMAGAGVLPGRAAAEATRQGWRVVALTFDEATALFVGKFWKRSVFDNLHETDAVGRHMARGGLSDEALANVVLATLGGMGIEVLDQRHFFSSWMMEPGTLTSRAPSEAEWEEIRAGFALARQIAGFRIGQTLVRSHGVTLAVEAAEGTDETIRRGARLAGKGAVVIKAVATEHDFRFDVPTVGATTLEAMAECGATVLAVDGGKMLLVDREAALRTAERAGIALVGV